MIIAFGIKINVRDSDRVCIKFKLVFHKLGFVLIYLLVKSSRSLSHIVKDTKRKSQREKEYISVTL